LPKINSLQDILYFMLKCVRIKYKISCKLLTFQQFYHNIFLYEIIRGYSRGSYFVKKTT